MLDKSVMLIGAALLLSAGCARYWLLGRQTSAATTVGLIGLVALLGASLLDVRATLLALVPTVDAALLWRYLTTTGHGAALQARLVFGTALAALLLVPDEATRTGRIAGGGLAFLAGTLGLLSSFSVLSHGAVMSGRWALVSDLVHFLAAGVWAGGVVGLSLAPVWEPVARDSLVAAVRRLSTVGLVAVGVLALTGTLNGLLQARDPGSFLASGYFGALMVKVGIVAVTVAAAALNRFRFLPRLLAGGSAASLRRSLAVEAVLLALVLLASGWLSTTAVPHDMTPAAGSAVNPIDNAARLIEHLRR